MAPAPRFPCHRRHREERPGGNFDMGVAIEGGSDNTVTGITSADNIGSGAPNGGDGIATLAEQPHHQQTGPATTGAFRASGSYADVDSALPGARAGRRPATSSRQSRS